jgi:molybdopterin/thiamine biosynthesis adenylyltransferase
MNTLSAKENMKLKDFKVFVGGCGGLGGFVIEELARLGIGTITAVDGDVFDETNLNRQLLSTMDSLGKSKAETAKKRISEVNPDVELKAIHTLITAENGGELVKGHDLVIDALDNISTRKILERACEREGIPLVHGAIAGWYGQIAVIYPGDRMLEKLYPSDADKGIEVELGNPSFTPAAIASIEVAEALKILLGKGKILRNKLLSINLLDHEYEIFHI